jgi:hypothetical protein
VLKKAIREQLPERDEEALSTLRDPLHRGSAASADPSELTIEPIIFLLDHLTQGVFLGLDLVGAYNIVLGWWEFEFLIVLLNSGIILGLLPTIDRSLHLHIIAIAGVDLGVCLDFSTMHTSGGHRQHDNSSENRAHGRTPPSSALRLDGCALEHFHEASYSHYE